MKLYRGGISKTSDAFYAVDMKIAKMYGNPVHEYTPTKKLKLFVITHDSLKRVFKYLSENTRLLLKVAFGTGLSGKVQNTTYKVLFGSSPHIRGSGQRMSVVDIDKLALAGFSKEYLLKHGYDGAIMPRKKSRFHTGTFHKEIYIARKGVLERKQSLSNLFLEYTKHTTMLLRPRREFIHFLGGGMAVKLYLKGRGIKTASTKDFDFKFAVSRSIRSHKQIEALSEKMKSIMFRHMNGFTRWLNRKGDIKSKLEIRELKGVPLDKPSKRDFVKQVYKVYTFSVNGEDLVDTSLVSIPGIKREKHISRKWSQYYGMPLPTLTRLWKDTLYVLAGSFVIPTAKLRNPINGNLKEKGIKNAIRTGHLSYLSSKRKGTSYLVDLSRRLVDHIIMRNKKASTRNSKKILSQLHLLQKIDVLSKHR